MCSSCRLMSAHVSQWSVSACSLMCSLTSFRVFCFAFIIVWPPLGCGKVRGWTGPPVIASEPSVSASRGVVVGHLFNLFVRLGNRDGLKDIAHPGYGHLSYSSAFPIGLD
jgi:hypothetical protein